MNTTTQQLLQKIVSQGMNNAEGEDVAALACAYWHEGFLPDVEQIARLPVEQQHLAGYLTEFFSTFNCLALEQSKKLIAAAMAIRQLNPPEPITDNIEVDDIAKEWGLTQGINNYLKDILPFQTRHYKHKKKDES